MTTKFAAMVTRTLKPDKTYEDYRKAWFHTNGFGVPTTMYTVVNAFNPREIISIGIVNQELKDLEATLAIDVNERLKNPLDDVVESTIVRNFGIVIAIDDFSAKGQLPYKDAQVEGKTTDYNELEQMFTVLAGEIKKATVEREKIKRET